MKRRIIAALLVIFMSFSFVGCSEIEKGFMDTMFMMSSMKDFSFSGTLNVTNNTKPVEQPDFTTVDNMEGALTDMMPTGSFAVNYDGVSNLSNNKISLNVSANIPNQPKPFSLNLIYDNKFLFINKDLFDTIPQDMPVKTTTVSIDGKEFVKIDLEKEIDDNINSSLSMIEELKGAPTYFRDPEMEVGAFYDAYELGYNAGAKDGYDGKTAVTDFTGKVEGYSAGYNDGYSAGVSKNEYETTMPVEMEKMRAELKSYLDLKAIFERTVSTQTKFSNFVKTFFDGFSTGAILKTAENKFQIDMDATDLGNVIESVMTYVMNNVPKLKASLTLLINSFSDDELKQLNMDREMMLEEISTMPEPTEQEKTDALNGIATLKTMLKDNTEMKMNYSVEKMGSKSFKENANFSVKLNEMYFYLPLDFSISNELYINKENGGQSGVSVSSGYYNGNKTVLVLDVADENVSEAGIIYSTNSDMSNSTKVKAVKNADGKYVVELDQLSKDKTYYYKTYTVDLAGNIVYSSEVKDLFASITNPKTSDNSNLPLNVLMLIIATTAFISVVYLRRKTK